MVGVKSGRNGGLRAAKYEIHRLGGLSRPVRGALRYCLVAAPSTRLVNVFLLQQFPFSRLYFNFIAFSRYCAKHVLNLEN